MSLFIFATWKIVEPELEPHSGKLQSADLKHQNAALVSGVALLLLNPSPCNCQAPVKPLLPLGLYVIIEWPLASNV